MVSLDPLGIGAQSEETFRVARLVAMLQKLQVLITLPV